MTNELQEMVREVASTLHAHGYTNIRTPHIQTPAGSPDLIDDVWLPDVTAITPAGRFVAIEVKTAEDALTAATKDRCEAMGFAMYFSGTRLMVVTPSSSFILARALLEKEHSNIVVIDAGEFAEYL